MRKTSATTLKAQFGKFMRAVRSGQEIIVTDRDQAVAKLVPFDAAGPKPLLIAAADPSAPAPGEVRIVPTRARGDSLALLLDDRGRR